MGALEFFAFFAWCFLLYSAGNIVTIGDFITTGFWFSVGLLVGKILFLLFKR